MSAKPRFTIVTVTFNAGKCLERTIQSVIRQSYDNVEYIIVDGGSTDNTKQIVEQYKSSIAIFLSEPDSGIYDGMNKGIALAHGDYLLFMNADDTFVDNQVLARVADCIDVTADVVYGRWQITTEHGAYHCSPGDIARLNKKWVLGHQALFVSVLLLKQRPFDIKYRYCGDYELISAYYLSGRRFQYVDVEIADMPITGGATYDNFEASVREHYAILAQRGLGNRLGAEWLILRKKVVRLLKTSLPKKLSDNLFAWLAKHYKVM